MIRSPLALALALAFGLVAGCADAPSPAGRDFAGPGVAVNLAALNLVGVGDVVWQRRVTSSGYGDSAGSASYVGPCDADAGQNTVKVWVVGVYAADVSAPGAFNSGSTAGAGAVTGTPMAFQNPTAAATPLTQTILCEEGRDVAVRFDVALMRPAQQGFFDVAVNFNDVFCSAKLDCQRAGGGDLELLFDATGARARTFVLGFACTPGTGDVDTQLYMNDVELDCTAPNDGEDFDADIVLRPDAPHMGNLCVASADGMSACLDSVTEVQPSTVDADDYLFQLAVYRGEELLTSGGDAANKQYWNVALGVKGPISACRLRTRATADDAGDAGDLVNGGVIAAGTVYPYVQWDVDLSACATEELTFDDPTASVRAAYTGTGDPQTAFAWPWAPSIPPLCSTACANGGSCVATDWCACTADWAGPTCATPVCDPACQNGGQCVDPDTCDCTDTGYIGATCESPALGITNAGGVREWDDGTYAASCYAYRFPDGVNHTYTGADIGSGLYRIDPTGGADFPVYCDMSFDGGGWTRVYYYDNAGAYFGVGQFTKNKANPSAALYAILNDLEYFRRGGAFEFKMDWPGSAYSGYQHWTQTSNPVTTAAGSTPTGVVGIHIDYTTNTNSSAPAWGGLQRSAAAAYSMLDGTLNPQANWYYAVGTTYCWGTAPNCQPSPDAGVQISELWVR